MSSRARRGAAVTEFLLGLLLMVPLVWLTILAGELFMGGARAQQAEVQAAWDLTGYRLHDYRAAAPAGRARGLYDRVATEVPAAVSKRLPRVKLVSVTSEQADVKCAVRRDVDKLLPFDTVSGFTPDPLFNGNAAAKARVDGTLEQAGYVSCRARVPFTAAIGWTRYLDPTPRADLDLLPPGALQLNGGGRAMLGRRAELPLDREGLAVVLDDWAVEEGGGRSGDAVAEREERSHNPMLYRVADRVFRLHGEAIGTEQIRELGWFVSGGAPPEDPAHASTFNLALPNAADERVRFSGGEGNPDRVLWDARTRELAQRRRETYLGHPDPAFNGP
jgi:hypothetical protein